MAVIDYDNTLYVTTSTNRENLIRVERGEATERARTAAIAAKRKIEQFLLLLLGQYNYTDPALRSNDGKIQLALTKSYMLLSEVPDDPLGKIYQQQVFLKSSSLSARVQNQGIARLLVGQFFKIILLASASKEGVNL